MNKSQFKQSGAALIVALFVMALIAAASIAVLSRLSMDTARTTLLINANQAALYTQGCVAWAIDQLNNNWARQQPKQMIDKLPLSFQDKKNGANITATLSDLQGYFNINTLSDDKAQMQFIRLLQTVAPNIDSVAAHDITAGVIDWISTQARNPAFDEYYLKLTPPLRAPHRLMASVSELRLVRGMTGAIYDKLVPYITALPGSTSLNVNQATAPVLMSLSPTLSFSSAQAIALFAHQNPFLTTEEFLNFDIVKNNNIPNNKLTTKSDYFLLQSTVTIGEQRIVTYTALHRGLKNSKPVTLILWQSKGTL